MSNKLIRAVEYYPGVTLDRLRDDYITSALHHFKGNITKTAAAIGISRKTIHYWMNRRKENETLKV